MPFINSASPSFDLKPCAGHSAYPWKREPVTASDWATPSRSQLLSVIIKSADCYCCSARGPLSWSVTPRRPKGRIAIVTLRRAGMRWTLRRQVIFHRTRIAAAYGKAVWSWRRATQAVGAVGVGAAAVGAAVVWASASDTVSIVGVAARPNAAANPNSERAFRREIVSDLMIALTSNLPG